MNYLDFTETALNLASAISKKHFGNVSSSVKDYHHAQVVTEADLEIGKSVVDLINKEFPKHNVIDEEAGVLDKGSEYTWVLDPVDGTSNFAEGLPLYGTILGLLKGSEVIAGGVALPFFNDITLAEKGKGTFSSGKKVEVTKEQDLFKVMVGYCIDGQPDKPEITRDECKLLSEIILKIRNLRITGGPLDAVYLAKGQFGGMLNRSSKIWDNVGMQIIVEEAGGVYTDFFGSPIDYSNPLLKAKDNFTYCAASPILHKKLQEIIQYLA